MKNRWMPDEDQFLIDHYEYKGVKYCCDQLSRTCGSVKCRAWKLGLKSRRLWSEEELKILKENFANMNSKQLAELIGKTLSSINTIAYKMGLKKSEAHIREVFKINNANLSKAGIAHRFSKGHTPKNKGKKMSPDQREKVKHTFFKKGHLPVNTLEDGAITTRRNYKRGTTHKYIRIAKAKWMELQIYNWMQKNGPVPKGKILRCKDGNTLNCDPENWYLTDRVSHLEKNAGRDTLEDKYVLLKLAPRDRELRNELARSPELIEMKRNQLKLKRIINEQS